MVSWEYFDRFRALEDKYLPPCGEGQSMATQIVTAVCKLVYKWYNDGDVYDNTYAMAGWANDLSCYANWLRENTDSEAILDRVSECINRNDYEALLKDLADKLLDEEYLERMAENPKTGSIYDAEGPFRFADPYEDDEE